MTLGRLLTRRILARWFRHAGRIALVLAWLLVASSVARYLQNPGSWDRVRLVLELSRLLRGLELAVALGAPLGMVMAVAEVRGRGILISYLAAGRPALGSLRRAFATAAALTCAVALVCLEATTSARRYVESTQKARHGTLWTAGDVYVWQPRAAPAGGEGAELILFRKSDLDVSVVAAAPGYRRTYRPAAGEPAAESPGGRRDTSPRALAGEPLDLPASRPERLGSIADFPPPPSRWFGASATLQGALGGITWILPGATLLVICGYLALLVPGTYQWVTYVVFLALVPPTGLLMLSSLVSLWTGSGAGMVVASLWVPVLAAVVAGLDRLLERRGVRLC